MALKYLLTGGTGHLGNVILKALAIDKPLVRVLIMKDDQTAYQLPDWVEKVYGSVCDRDSLALFFDNPQKDDLIVIHAAGIVSIASKYDQLVYNVNVNGTKNIIALCQKHCIHKLIYVSSVHAIPEKPQGEFITEVSLFDPDKVTGLYAKTKAEATQAVLDAGIRGLNVSVVHPSGIIGPYDYGNGHMNQLIIDYYKGDLVAIIHGGYDFVDVRDVARGIISCCRRGRPGECYILSNRYYSVEELTGLLHTVTGKKEIKTILPLWFARSTAPMAELYYKILRRKPLYTAYSIDTLSSNSAFSHKKADGELNYTVTPMEVTLRDTIEWLKCQSKV